MNKNPNHKRSFPKTINQINSKSLIYQRFRRVLLPLNLLTIQLNKRKAISNKILSNKLNNQINKTKQTYI